MRMPLTRRAAARHALARTRVAVSRISLLTLCTCLGAAPAAADLPAPFGLSWGAAIEDVGRYSDVEDEGQDVGATLYPDGVPADTQEVVGFFCGGVGLQEIQVASGRYDRLSILPRFNRSLTELERDHGAPNSGDPDIGTAYWANGLALEAYPASKTKFIVVLTYRGPDHAACASLAE